MQLLGHFRVRSGRRATIANRSLMIRSGHRPRQLRLTENMECLADHSGLMPADLITLAHFSVSSTMSLPKSAGEPESTVPPKSASRAFILGSATTALISLFSLLMIAAGVFLGAPTPCQLLAS